MISLLILGELATALYIGGIAQAAVLTGVAYVLFPELAALSYDVFTRPRGTWAKAPWMLVFTPFLTALAGIVIERHLGYGFVPVLLCIASALVIIKAMNSPIAPAISAGFLPVVLDVSSWWYPVSILFGTVLLAITLQIFRGVFAKTIDEASPEPDAAESDAIEQPPRQYTWLPFFLAFLLCAIWMVEITGLRFILFPPLVVIGFEMFAHSEVCPWAERPFALTLACMLTALAGTGINLSMGSGPFAAILAVAAGTVVCRLFRLHIPPALAVGLLPFVMPHPDFRFPIAVGAGTFLLAVIFLSYRYLSSRIMLVKNPE
jgi:hypothetical protein